MKNNVSIEQAIFELEELLAEISQNIAEARRLDDLNGEDHADEIAKLKAKYDKAEKVLAEACQDLTPWGKVLLARHIKRPYTLDYISTICDDFQLLHGDRLCADDAAMVCGIGKIDDIEFLFVGHQKGRNLKERVLRNFGSARPEGYRKALRLMTLAGRFNRPIVCFVDTPAAACDLEAEARGISQAIAENMTQMSLLPTPILSIVIGEGGSGGAIGIAVADRVLMLEHSIYSVIPPEGCAAILWRDPTKGKEAAEALQLTAQSALHHSIIDEIITEPIGGAHRNMNEIASRVKSAILRHLNELEKVDTPELLKMRYTRFRSIGKYTDN